ncbi:MAG: hypothetical protein GPJ54_10360 [Candidatus Heimdallarchaeota archaeon]|nr:hypothetical protein [Candidatus Heimdallarchaeota archaeon]
MDTEDLSILLISTFNGIFYFIYFLPHEYFADNPTKPIIHKINSVFILQLLYVLVYLFIGIIYHRTQRKRSARKMINGVVPNTIIIGAGIIFQFMLEVFVIDQEDTFLMSKEFQLIGFIFIIALLPLLILLIPHVLLFTLGVTLSELKIIPTVNLHKINELIHNISERLNEFGVKRL